MNALSSYRVLPLLKKPGALYIVFAAILIAFWPLTFFDSTLKWDALDISLPWRIFVNDCLHQFILPLWNPFQHHGFPAGFIPETWYPLPILINFFFGYNLYTFNLEFLFHLFIASWGFYRLSRVLGLKSYSSIFAALIFPLSGFFTANAQHLGWIIAAAWIPHVIYAYLEFRNKQHWKYGFEFALYYFMLLSGGYPAYSIVISYIILALALAHLIKSRGSWSNFSFTVSRHSQLFVLIAIVGSVLWISFYELKNELLRGSGISAMGILEGSFRLKHILSLIYPWATVTENNTYWMGDQSMISIYLGIPVLGLLILSFFLLHKSFVKWAWVISLLFLFASLAAEFPLRRWLNILPFFDLFRFSSLFRLFAEMGLILAASKTLEFVVEEKRYLFLARRVLLFQGVAFVLLFLSFSFSNTSQHLFLSEASQHLKGFFIRESLINTVISFSLFAGCIWVPGRITSLFFILAFADLFLTIQLNGKTSVFSSERFSELSKCVNSLPRGFPVPPLWSNIGAGSDRDLQAGPLYRNTNTLYKRIGWNGYIPYQFTVFDSLEKANEYDKSLNLPPVYLSALRNDTLSNGSLISFPELGFRDENFRIENFNPNSWTLSLSTDAPKLLVLNQNYYAGWKSIVNGEFQNVSRVDRYLMSVELPAGVSDVELHFKPGRLINGIIISGTALLLMLIRTSWSYWGITGRIVTSGILLFIGLKGIYIYYEKKGLDLIWDLPNNNPVIVNLVDQSKHSVNSSDVLFTRYLCIYDMPDFDQRIANLNSDKFYFINRSTCLLDTDSLLKTLNLTYKRIKEDSKYVCLEVEKNSRQQSILSLNAFEHPVPWWTNIYEGRKYDRVRHSYYQEIAPNREFSSAFELPLAELPETVKTLSIKATCKGENLKDALLVCSVDINNETIYWNVHRLSDFMTSSEWSDISLIADLNGIPRQDGLLRVYIWNPGVETILVDKIEISRKVG